MNTPETAPNTGEEFLGDFGYPWWVLTCWNEADELWIISELRMDHPTNAHFEVTWEQPSALKGWIPLPEKV